MKSGTSLKQIAFVFVLAFIFYAITYRAIENRRVRRGPWEVTFTRESTGSPKLIINQPALGITNLELVFNAQEIPATTHAQTMTFAQPRPVPFNVPYGDCIFMDTTFLPGTLTFQLLGHEIELLPRTLIIDRREMPWSKSPRIVLEKPPAPKQMEPRASEPATR